MQKELDEAIKIIERNICQIEQSLGFTALFGAVGGSLGFHLSSGGSDIDFYLIVEWKNQKGQMMQSQMLEGRNVDLVCVALDDVLDIWEGYRKEVHKYPTRFYRSDEEMKKIAGQKDIERADYVREILIKIFLAEKVIVFCSGVIEEKHSQIQKCVYLIDAWDFQFNRAYGNYYESIHGKEEVSVRKYLYTIHQVSLCYAIMRGEEIVMDFEKMLSSHACPCREDWFCDCCLDLFKKNKFYKGDKKGNKVPADARLNKWIEEKLKDILGEAEQKEDFMRNSYLDISGKLS